jgi:hypothetical protein
VSPSVALCKRANLTGAFVKKRHLGWFLFLLTYSDIDRVLFGGSASEKNVTPTYAGSFFLNS